MRRRRAKSKYGNHPVVIDGVRFDSIKEANRWCELKLLQKAGVISDLQRQVKFELQPSFYFNGRKIQAINYIADHTYYQDGQYIVEDVKGVKTREYINKKKMMMYIHNIEIKEV